MELEQKGISAYLAELIGTFLLVFFITSVVTLYVSTGAQSSFGSDFAVVGFVQGLTLFGVICMFGAALVSNEWGGTWPYLVGPLVGSLVAVGVWRFVIEAGGPSPVEPPQRVAPAAARGGKGAGPAEPKKLAPKDEPKKD